jgi:photosystem II stability/assembly factor-like uncharacterized protein
MIPRFPASARTRAQPFAAAAALLVPLASSAQTAPATAQTSSAEADAIRRLQWRAIGPANNAGRIPAIAGIPGDPNIYYVGAAAGGIIKTTNGGVTFTSIFDDQTNVSIGDIAIAPSDVNVIYVGTGEGNPRNSASIGDGMYKSIDAGKTWTKIGLEKTEKIPRIRVDPRNHDIVYVCALGRTWGPNEDRGLYKTTDGGKSWRKILSGRDQTTGCSDVDIHPTNSNIVYAGLYTHRRYPWYFTSGGVETAMYRSVDGGTTWTKLSGPDVTRGLPRGLMDRIGIAVARSNPDVVYVVSETKDEGELWRSDDGGDSWRTVNRDPNINFRPFYYSDIRVDPQNPNKIFSLSGSLNVSEDGGRTFTRVANEVHGDHQAMWIDPTNPTRILEGSDGGWQVSNDGGRTWEVINTFAFTQFYHVNYDMRKPYYVCGGLQDNGHVCGPSNSLSTQGNRKADWYTVSGGDGFFAVPDLARPHLVYSASQGGNMTITDLRTGDARSIHPDPNRVGSAGDALESHKYRFNWNAAIALDPSDPQTVYFGGNVVFKTRNHGQSWEIISPDLTTNDKSKQKSSGGPIVTDNTAAEFHSTILSIAPSPKDRNVIWVGTDDGNVQVTRDGGKTWTNTFRNPPGLPPNAWISTVEASPTDGATAYVAASHWQTGDYAPYVYKTTDYGQTWRRISSNLPAIGWVHVVRQDPKNANLLYVGTEFGVFASWDSGNRWVSIRNGIPPAPVRDLLVHPRDNDLIIATHGRGMYILDDITPLQQIGTAMNADVALFDIRPAARYMTWGRDGNLGAKDWAGRNPPVGAGISYYLKTATRDSARLTIADRGGRVIRTIRNLPRNAGVNRVTWDLRYDGPAGAPGGAGGEEEGGGAAGGEEAAGGRGGRGGGGGGGGRGGGAGGPFVVPGDYTVTLAVGGRTIPKTVRVESDPRVTVDEAALVAQRDASLELRDLSSRVNGLVDRSNDLIGQLTALQTRLRRTRDAGEATAAGGQALAQLNTEVNTALAKMRELRDSVLVRPIAGLGYRQYPRLREEVNSLYGSTSRSLAPPTDPQRSRSVELKGETDQAARTLNVIISTHIAQINKIMAGAPHIVAGVPIMD